MRCFRVVVFDISVFVEWGIFVYVLFFFVVCVFVFFLGIWGFCTMGICGRLLSLVWGFILRGGSKGFEGLLRI